MYPKSPQPHWMLNPPSRPRLNKSSAWFHKPATPYPPTHPYHSEVRIGPGNTSSRYNMCFSHPPLTKTFTFELSRGHHRHNPAQLFTVSPKSHLLPARHPKITNRVSFTTSTQAHVNGSTLSHHYPAYYIYIFYYPA